MKASRIILVMAIILALTGWSIEPNDRNNTAYRPVLLKKSDLPSSIFIQPVREFSNPGKVYLFDDYIYIVDLYKGIHVINNQDAENPKKEGFIHIPGVVDVAIQNHVLFADNAIDLVAINISSFPEISITDRVEDVFPEHTPPDLEWIPQAFTAENRPKNTVIVGWEKLTP